MAEHLQCSLGRPPNISWQNGGAVRQAAGSSADVAGLLLPRPLTNKEDRFARIRFDGLLQVLDHRVPDALVAIHQAVALVIGGGEA